MTYQEFTSQIENFDGRYDKDINSSTYFSYPIKPILEAEDKLASRTTSSIAYFSMEYGLAPSIYNSFHLNSPMSDKNIFFKHQVFSNYWVADYVFK
ncbi:MAG: hypothetical protein HQL13_07035, partial [Candidatus Omnitrophica bacterium]|nr:hypothetical protein [Candidatus Omnitrophota bacterium]